MPRLIPLILALFMEGEDSTVIAISLLADIGTTPVALKLAFTAYFVALKGNVEVSLELA